MGLRKPEKKKAPKPKRAAKDDGPGWFSRAQTAWNGTREGLSAVSNHIYRAFFGVLVVACLIAWIMGREPLQKAVASLRAEIPKAIFDWPRSPNADRRSQTWMPPALQNDLMRAAIEGVSANPFDQASLEASHRRLLLTGWFETLEAVRRKPGGEIVVEGKWRVPVAVVRQDGRDHLIASGGEILRLPPGLPVSPGSMPIIYNPYALAPRDQTGAPSYGKAWPGGDVQDAIRLISTLRSRPGYERIIGVELNDYMTTGHLTLVSNTGARFIWGSALGRNAPGEAPAERRLANLKSILDEHRDSPGYRYEIYTPYVLVDTTLTRE